MPSATQAHDASAWGGLFRTRDLGASWFQANQGRLVGGALSIAVSPSDPNVLLLGTDSGLLATSNGGLDWFDVAPDLFGRRPVLAVQFTADGRGAMAAADRELLRSSEEGTWQRIELPRGASPVRSLVRGQAPRQMYVLGWRGMFRSDDWGASWAPIDNGLPDAEPGGLVVVDDTLLAAVGGSVWSSGDNGSSWRPRHAGLPADAVQTLSFDGRVANSVWAAGADRVFRSDDRGITWQPVGQPLPDAATDIRGIAADSAGASLLVSTHRGVYMSADAGVTWSLVGTGVPGHLEAGPLVAQPTDSHTVYVGFSLVPYGEQWAAARTGRGGGTLSGNDLIGGAAFLLLVALIGGASLHWLRRTREPRDHSGAEVAA